MSMDTISGHESSAHGQATISDHIAKLKAANLVDSEKIGIWSFYRLRKELFPAALNYIELIP